MIVVKILKSDKPKKKYMAVFYDLNKNHLMPNGILMSGKTHNKDSKPVKPKTIYFGAAGYKDFILYYLNDGRKIANQRKGLYLARHKNEDWSKPFSAGTLSRYILWGKPTLKESINNYVRKFKLKLI